MTFPSLRKIVVAAAVLVAVGLVVACGPYYEPDSNRPAPPSTQCPIAPLSEQPRPCITPPASDVAPPARVQAPVMTYYYQPVTNAQGQTTYVLQCAPPGTAPGLSGTSLSVLDGKIQMQTSDGARMSCEKLTILVGGVDPAEVSTAGTQIKVASGKDVKEGSFLQATAQKVTRAGTDGAQLILEGDAKLLYVRKGKRIEVSADLVSVNLSTGQVLSEMDAPKPTAPPVLQSAPPPPPTVPQAVSPAAPSSSLRPPY